MNTFYLVRHGRTMNNHAGRLSGWIDTPLTDEGLKSIPKIANALRHLSVNMIYTSDLGRAFITASLIAESMHYSGVVRRLPGLREVNFGDTAHMLREDAYALYPCLKSSTRYSPPNGESLEQMRDRVTGTVNEINSTHSDSSILLVAHSGVIAALDPDGAQKGFDGHNFTEMYAHDGIWKFSLRNGLIDNFTDTSIAELTAHVDRLTGCAAR